MYRWQGYELRRASAQLRGWLQQPWKRNRTRAYWLKSVIAIVLGVIVGYLGSERHWWLAWRYEVSRAVQVLQPRQHAKLTTLVAIEDDEFWRGPLERRTPLKRDYLATLVRKVAQCGPSVIALDFRMWSPVVEDASENYYNTKWDNRRYGDETSALVKSIKDVVARGATRVVIPVGIMLSKGKLAVMPSVLEGLRLQAGKIARGDISLPVDYRQVLTVEQMRSENIPSFALAAAGLFAPNLLSKFKPGEIRYNVRFLEPEDFDSVSYHQDVPLLGSDCENKIRNKIVVVAGAWHLLALGHGEVADVRADTPMGPFVGAQYLHANYIEALLDDRARSQVPTIVAFIVEVGASIWIAVLLAGGGAPHPSESAAKPEPIVQARWRFLAIFDARHRRLGRYMTAGAISCGLLFVTYIFAQNLGLYADFFFPAVFVFLHAWWHDWSELTQSEVRLRQVEVKLAAAEAELTKLRPPA
jgi:hypothetical protein